MKQQTPTPTLTLPQRLAREPDLVDRIFEYIIEQLPELASRAPELQAAVRAEFSGEEVKIGRRSPDERQRLVEEVLRAFNGRNATEIARRLGIGRATVYRWLKQAGRPGDDKQSHFSAT